MNPRRNTPFKSIKNLLVRLVSGRVHFLQVYSGRIIAMEDGKEFQVIRDLKIDPKQSPEKTVAIFKVRFKFSGLPLVVNKRLSIFPAPFLIAMSGFREKIWAVSEDGYFQGIYQWASYEFAESYPRSIIYKLMTKRSAEGTLTYEILADTELSNYVNNLIADNKSNMINETY